MVLRITIVAAGVIYVALWAFAIATARGLIPILATPLALVVLIAGGNWLSSFMGLPARATKFEHRDDDDA